MKVYSRPAGGGITGEREPAQLRPFPGPVTTPDRKLICLRLIERTNGIKARPPERCQSERLPGSALCARHLGEAAADFRRIVQDNSGEASGD